MYGMQSESALASDLGSEKTSFYTPNGSLSCLSRITFEPINGAEPVSPGTVTSLLIISKESQSAKMDFFHCKLLLVRKQLQTVIRVKIVAKSNKFTFSTILVQDRK